MEGDPDASAIQLHSPLAEKGKENFKSTLIENKAKLLERCRKILGTSYHEQMELALRAECRPLTSDSANLAISPFTSNPCRPFLNVRKDAEEGAFECDMSWIDRDDRSNTELLVTAWNRPLFLEKICCALAAHEINIISADVYTRADGVVCDLFQVCTVDREPVTSERDRKRVLANIPRHQRRPRSLC